VPLDFFYNIFLLDFSLETAQSAFQRFALLQMNFCQKPFTTFRSGVLKHCSLVLSMAGHAIVPHHSDEPAQSSERSRFSHQVWSAGVGLKLLAS
jgi:hypothetical protein